MVTSCTDGATYKATHCPYLKIRAGKCMLLVQEAWNSCLPACYFLHDVSLALSGSNQAREGRLVNALAVRGDEGRDTLR